MVEISDIYRRRFPDFPWGPQGDPGPDIFLPKDLLAQIKVKALEMQIRQLEMQMDMLRLEKDLLVKEYKLG